MATENDPKQPQRPTWFQVQRKLGFLLEFGTADDAIALAKLIDPNVSEEQQKRIAKLFHDAKLARGPSQ
jgi:hypothetical protein